MSNINAVNLNETFGNEDGQDKVSFNSHSVKRGSHLKDMPADCLDLQ